MNRWWCCIGLMLASLAANAQTDGPRLFLNCSGECYGDFLRTELGYFNFVRDRFLSDIEVLVIEQQHASGGKRFTLSFTGRQELAGMRDSLTFTSLPSETDDHLRRRLLQGVKLGLLTFLRGTPAQEQIAISFGEGELRSTNIGDRWNYWVLEPGLDVSGGGGSNNFNAYFHFGGTANRITEKSKFMLAAGYDHEYSRYRLDGERITGENRSYDAGFLYVRSINSHWSTGGLYGLVHTSYENIDLLHKTAAAIEYNIFPYEQNTSRQMRLQYQVGARDYRYGDTTILDKVRETRPYHKLSLLVEINKSWGTINSFVHGQFFLDKMSQHHFGAGTDLKLRLFKGLSLVTGGSLYYIRDQISLLKTSLGTSDYLLGTQQLPTSFSFSFNMGISYTFGSIYNSIVNPRFNGME